MWADPTQSGLLRLIYVRAAIRAGHWQSYEDYGHKRRGVNPPLEGPVAKTLSRVYVNGTEYVNSNEFAMDAPYFDEDGNELDIPSAAAWFRDILYGRV